MFLPDPRHRTLNLVAGRRRVSFGNAQTEPRPRGERTTAGWQFSKAEALFCQNHSQLPSHFLGKSRCSPGPTSQICDYARILVFLCNICRSIRSCWYYPVLIPAVSCQPHLRGSAELTAKFASTHSCSHFARLSAAGQSFFSAVCCRWMPTPVHTKCRAKRDISSYLSFYVLLALWDAKEFALLARITANPDET